MVNTYLEMVKACWNSGILGKLFLVLGGGWAILAVVALIFEMLSGMKH